MHAHHALLQIFDTIFRRKLHNALSLNRLLGILVQPIYADLDAHKNILHILHSYHFVRRRHSLFFDNKTRNPSVQKYRLRSGLMLFFGCILLVFGVSQSRQRCCLLDYVLICYNNVSCIRGARLPHYD